MTRGSDVRPPSRETIEEIASSFHIELTSEEVDYFNDVMTDQADAIARLDKLAEPRRTVEHSDRMPGYRSGRDEDPYNAFVT